MSHERFSHQTVFFKYTKISMSICGLWPFEFENRALNFLYKCYRYMLRIEMITSLMLGGPLGLPYVLINHPKKFSETLGYEIQYLMLLIRVMIYESDVMRDVLKQSLELEEEILAADDRKVIQMLMKNKKINVRLSAIYTFMICSAFFFFLDALVIRDELIWNDYVESLNSTIDASTLKRSPIVWTLPPLSGNLFYLGKASQIFGVMIVISYSVGAQAMTFSYITFAVFQLQALRLSLSKFEENVEKLMSSFESKEACTLFSLRKNIQTHQKIIKYVKTLDKCLKGVSLLDFFFYSLQIGAVVTQILSELQRSEYSNVMFHMNYLMFNYLEIYFNYSSAHEIIYESSNLSRSIFKSYWYKQSVKVQKMYVIMMMRMKEPLSLHIGPLYSMSNELLILVLKAAYSYVTLLSGGLK